ncbi:hypothetical protein BJ508DRAFT_412225 [Ascobolus immersus RN42]|uniref:Gamma interferon inducible lysosomal thiol reductase n=1 Tax=Ascobolus immersus RN42 TaxID=1160509 RepID=A0A3N4IU13_ASCIM|nr:hypothetical protein BJ508DRAFT_412225 [Ascobolus immersus RN42]
MPRTTPILILLGLGTALFILLNRSAFNQDAQLRSVFRSNQPRSLIPNQLVAPQDGGQQPLGVTDEKKVPLEVFIMSKCPDARDAFDLLIAPAFKKVQDLVDFKIEFIGRATSDGLICMHGPTECLGNVVNACAQKEYPSDKSMPFTHCLLDDYRNVPKEDLLLRCAKENGLEFETINECASDTSEEGGLELVRGSFQRASELGVKRSATIRLAGEDWCTRDGGRWKDCKGTSDATIVDEFVRAVRNHAGA